jgi:hypothetical protein
MNKRKTLRSNLVIVVCALLISGLTQLLAQTTTATLSGTVTDSSGAAIAETQIVIRNNGTGASRSVTSDAAGRYNVPDLPPGQYEVQASKAGFTTSLRKGIELTVGSQVVADLSLTVGQQNQTVTVSAEAVQVETTSATLSNLVDEKQIADLPLNGRNFDQLILLSPGVQLASTASASLYGKGNYYAISGGRPVGVAMLLDGTDIADYYQHSTGAASIGTSLGLDAIAEFQTLVNTYGAQFGGNGGAINAVSKSGTNAFHGTAFEYLRNSDLDARNFFDGKTVPSFRRNQFGGSLGGPIKKNKAFFFFNYEGLRQSLGVTNIALVPDANTRQGILGGVTFPLTPLQQSILALYPATSLTSASGIVSVPQVATQATTENYYIGRFDYNISSKDSLFVRFVVDRGQLTNPFAGSVIPDWPDLEKSPNLFLTTEERRIISPTLINVARLSMTRTDNSSHTTESNSLLDWVPANVTPQNSQYGTIAITGLSSLGAYLNDPFRTLQYKYTASDDVFWTKGTHSLQMGISAQRLQTLFYLPLQVFGAYTFTSVTQFFKGIPSTFRGSLPGSTDSYHWYREYPITAYFNDDWKATSKLTLNLGLRYSYDTNPVTLTHDIYDLVNAPYGTGYTPVNNVWANDPNTKNFDPRIGLAYDPFKDHKTSIRAGFGIFHQVLAPRDYAGCFATHKPLITGTITNPPFPNPYQNSVNVPQLTDSACTYYRNGTAPYQMQWNTSIQRELLRDYVLTVSYVGSAGRHLLLAQDLNPPIPATNASGQQVFATAVNGNPVANPRINPNFGLLLNFTTNGNSSYNALQVNFAHRFSHNFQAQVAYTWSHTLDDTSGGLAGELGGAIENPYNAHADWSNSRFDIRESARINGTYTLPFRQNKFVSGWAFNGIQTISGGLPFTPTDGFDNSNFGVTMERPNLNPGYTAGSIVIGKQTQWFNPAAFSLPPTGVLGNVGRDILRGPGIVDTDFSVTKDTAIPAISEHFNVQFRAELFNIFNHTNLSLPSAGVFTGTGAISSSVGLITATSTTSRQIQFALRIGF